jgi:hypothetical protein
VKITKHERKAIIQLDGSALKSIYTENSNINFFLRSMELKSWAPVVHACDPSYLEGRDKEDHSLRPA